MPISPTPICVAADKREQYSLQREWDVRERSGRENQQLLCHCASSETGQPLGDTWREPGCVGGLDFLVSLSHRHVCEAGGVGCFRPLQACLSGGLSGRRCKGREAEPALARWVLRSPSARRANQLQGCNSRTPFLTTASSHLPFLSQPLFVYLVELFFLLPTYSPPSPTHPTPDPHPISSVTVSPSLYTTLCFVSILWSLCKLLTPRNSSHLSPFFCLDSWLPEEKI